VSSIGLARDGGTVAIADGSKILLHAPNNQTQVFAIPDGSAAVSDIVLTGDGRFFASASSNDGWIQLWDPASGGKLAELDSRWVGVCRIALSRSGRWLAAMNHDRQLRLWDVAKIRERVEAAGIPW
jgi:WD40 repeat protein